jgi:hypothetical protein
LEEVSKSLEQLEIEINVYKKQTADGIIEIGKRLIEAKAQLQHGEWGKWLEEKVDFTQNTANRFMRIASNYESTYNLGTEKLFKLLEIPKEEREEFIEENNVRDMTVKELQKVIKEKKEAEENAENLKVSHSMLKRLFEETHEKAVQLEQKLIEQKPQIIEKEVVKEVIPSEIQSKIKRLESDLQAYKLEAETYRNDSNKLKQIKDSIKHLESHRNKLNEYIFQTENLSKLKSSILVTLKNDLSPLRYSGLIEASKNNPELKQSLEEILQVVKNWLDDMTRELITNYESEVIEL